MGEDIRKDGPQTHLLKKGTPTMGGLVFVFVVCLVTFISNSSRTQTLLPIFVATCAGLLGILEDFTKVYRRSGLPGFFEYHFSQLRGKLFASSFKFKPWEMFKEFWRIVGTNADSGITTYQKFLLQSLVALFVSYWTYFKLGWDYIWFPLLGNIHVGLMYPVFIFCLFIVVLNFISVSDGLDGLLGGLSLFAMMAFWVISSFFSYNSLSGLCATFVGALIPFLYFNIYPARVFMGNVGSHVLAAALVMLSIVLHREIALLVVAFVPLFDGFTSPLQSFSAKFTKKRLFRMAPIHHHFELLGWPETKVMLRFWLFGIIFGFLGIFVSLL